MRKLVSLLLLFYCVVTISAQETYQKKVFVSVQGDSLNYRLLRPEVEKPGKKYP